MYVRYCLVTLLLLQVSGCASRDRYVPPVTLAHKGLLFDAQPGYPSADDVRIPHKWPTTFSRYQDTEYISYQVTIYDLQGLWPSGRDYTYRRFQLRRTGGGTR